jgi:MraZ protein
MFTGFFGTSENSIDDKNRLIIPARFRNELGNRFMLTKGFDKCLYIYKMEDYEVLVNKIRKLPQSDRDVRRFIREFFANTEICEADSQWRIKIPANLRKYAGIDTQEGVRAEKELVINGAMDKIEIWTASELGSGDGGNLMDNDDFVAKIQSFTKETDYAI